jgi:DNA-binding NarL/FixJ family response regulator
MANQKGVVCKAIIKCVLLAERHHGLTEGIQNLLESAFDAVMMVTDPDSLLEGAQRLRPTVAVVELSLARDNGLNLLRTLHSRCPETKIIVLSIHGEPAVARSVLEAGTHGYVLKSAIATDLLPAVEAVLAGDSYVSPAVKKQTK